MAEMFTNAIAYENMTGRWSKRLAPLFLDFAHIGDADRILDVGCGTGSLVQIISDRIEGAHIVGIDPAQPSIDYSRMLFSDSRITFDCGSALKLPYEDASFAHALSLLVFQFLTEPAVAANEMRRVTRPGGTVAACTWPRMGFEMIDIFWRECVRLDPRADDRSQRPRQFNEEGQLAQLWRATGLEGIKEVTLELHTDFTFFDDYWVPFTKGVGPPGVYVASLSAEERDALRDALRKRLVGDRDRPFSLRAKALAVRGTVPN